MSRKQDQAEIMQRFGRYFLLDRVAEGGMAQIYRARPLTLQAARRILIIKKILVNQNNHDELLEMFKAEIQLTMGFSHPNIAQVYDFGEVSGQPYIALEYVEGRNLREIQLRSQKKQKPFPMDLAIFVVDQVAAGLGYAHEFKDKLTNQPLHIVHRDVSPHNILVSIDGAVKLIDFGIAKTAVQFSQEKTRDGIIKGKVSYLSPEQIKGQELDGRSDLFALGAILWELLAGRKLFMADQDGLTIHMIENCDTVVKPPSTYNPLVPKELDWIVLRSLARNRDKRFKDASEFRRTLIQFLFSEYPEFSPNDLGHFVKSLFEEDIEAERETIRSLSQKAEILIEAKKDPTLATVTPPPAAKKAATTVVQKQNPKAGMLDILWVFVRRLGVAMTIAATGYIGFLWGANEAADASRMLASVKAWSLSLDPGSVKAELPTDSPIQKIWINLQEIRHSENAAKIPLSQKFPVQIETNDLKLNFEMIFEVPECIKSQ